VLVIGEDIEPKEPKDFDDEENQYDEQDGYNENN
jgi:hypothetical protein